MKQNTKQMNKKEMIEMIEFLEDRYYRMFQSYEQLDDEFKSDDMRELEKRYENYWMILFDLKSYMNDNEYYNRLFKDELNEYRNK